MLSQEEKKRAEQELEEVLQKWAHVFGPRGSDVICDECDLEDIPDGIWVPSGWVLAVDWGSMQTGETWTTIRSPDETSRAVKIGLSIMALESYK